MARAANILYLASAMLFVASGIALATMTRPAVQIVPPVMPEALSHGLMPIAMAPPAATLPQLYVQPQSLLMWALLIALWGLLLLDGIQRYRQPADGPRNPARLPLTCCLAVGAIWPWIVTVNTPVAILGALMMLCAALSGAIQARGQARAAPGFLAGWSLALGTATVATLIGAPLSLTTPQAALLAILSGAVIGLIAQDRIGPSISFSLALIWAFCAVAVSTMGSSPGVALAAIIGISGMGVVLVRAAT